MVQITLKPSIIFVYDFIQMNDSSVNDYVSFSNKYLCFK